MNLLPFHNSAGRMEPLRALTLDDLWKEAESLGFIRVRTQTNFADTLATGYAVTIKGQRRNTKIEVERQHSVLHCAFADAINEAREMGLGEPS